jgi:hypothetical protein
LDGRARLIQNVYWIAISTLLAKSYILFEGEFQFNYTVNGQAQPPRYHSDDGDRDPVGCSALILIEAPSCVPFGMLVFAENTFEGGDLI